MHFTEEQLKEVTRIYRHAWEQGFVWGVVMSIATGVGITIAVLAARQWGYLFF